MLDAQYRGTPKTESVGLTIVRRLYVVELAIGAMVARKAASFSIFSAFGAQHVLYTTRLTPGPAWLGNRKPCTPSDTNTSPIRTSCFRSVMFSEWLE
jgi:hypothetical protein